MIQRILNWLSRHSELSKEVDREFEAIEALSVEDAHRKAIEYIEKYPTDFKITLNDSDLVTVPQKIEQHMDAFFKKYKEIYVIQGDARIRIFTENEHHSLKVCKCDMDDVEYALEDGGPAIIQCKHKEEDPEKIKSIFHLTLMSV